MEIPQIIEYYNQTKEINFNNNIHNGFKEIHKSLVDIRYSKSTPDSLSLTNASDLIDHTNSAILFFVSGLLYRTQLYNILIVKLIKCNRL
jgi:hypothetical protein